MEPVEIKLVIWQELIRTCSKACRDPKELHPLAVEAAKVAQTTYNELKRVVVEAASK